MGFLGLRLSNRVQLGGCAAPISMKKGFGIGVDGTLLLVEEEPSYWLIWRSEEFCDWSREMSLGKSHCLQHRHTGGRCASNIV